jgi:hypothetical protein
MQHRDWPLRFDYFRHQLERLRVEGYAQAGTAIRPQLAVAEVVTFWQVALVVVAIASHFHQPRPGKTRASMHEAGFRNQTGEDWVAK